MFIYLKHKIIKKLKKFLYYKYLFIIILAILSFCFLMIKIITLLNLLFTHKEKRAFVDVGGNIGVSTIGFRELGFSKNRIFFYI